MHVLKTMRLQKFYILGYHWIKRSSILLGSHLTDWLSPCSYGLAKSKYMAFSISTYADGDILESVSHSYPHFYCMSVSHGHGFVTGRDISMVLVSSASQDLELSLSTSKPDLLFQAFETADNSLYSVPAYLLDLKFRTEAKCCVYVRKKSSCSRADDTDSSEFFVIWLRPNWHLIDKHILAIYPSLNLTKYEHSLTIQTL